MSTIEQAPTSAGDPYTPPAGAPTAVLVDIDGTIALRTGDRSPFDWHRVGEDEPSAPVIETVQALHTAGHAIVVMSGRDAVCRRQTEVWLAHHLPAPVAELHMRAAKDNRPDWQVKRDLFDRHVRHRYTVLLVLDDRDQVVTLWRAMGLPCFQVAAGDF